MKKIVAANWKMYKGPKQTREFFNVFLNRFTEVQRELNPGSFSKEIVFFPSAISLESASESLSGSTISWGAQNCYLKSEGAFTGENSAMVVSDLGGRYVLVGHSERRSLFGESDEFLSQKVQFIQNLNLIPMLCVGETLIERESGKTQEVVSRQLELGLRLARPELPIAIAYEPVWAIGTGKVATVGQVQETHSEVRSQLDKLKFMTTPILYGGSVKPENAKELSLIKNVDGFLVGGASLEVESFLRICLS